MARRLTSAAFAATCLVATACGARVSPYLAQAAPAQLTAPATAPLPGQPTTAPLGGQPGLTMPTTGGGGPAVPTSVPTGSSPMTGESPSSSQAATIAALTPSTFDFAPQAEAAYCTGTAGNKASAPGVTPTSITVGNVSGITGTVSGEFGPSVDAVRAVFDAIDASGGICGRKLDLDVEDDQQSSSTHTSDIDYLIPKVLAFVGSASDGDNGGVTEMTNAKVPDIGRAANTNRSVAPNFWSADGGAITVKHGEEYVDDTVIHTLKEYGKLPKSVAMLSYGIPIAADVAKQFEVLFRLAHVPICYTNYSVSPAPGTTMGSIVATMKSKNCGGVFTIMDIVGNGDMLRDMLAQNYRPPLVLTSQAGYTDDQVQAAGEEAAQGFAVFMPSAPLDDNDPGMALYRNLLSTYEPGNETNEFGIEAFADAEMFVYSLLKAGRNPTRASLTKALGEIPSWNTDGAFGPYTPNTHQGTPCYDIVHVKGAHFTRWLPPTGFDCKGKLQAVGPA